MDYIVKDSSLRQNPKAFAEYDRGDYAVRVGIVRQELEENDGTTKYLVEVFSGGKQIPVACTIMSRFGSVYNYEEWRPRGWARNTVGGLLSPTTASSYDLRDGDTVMVAFIDGQSREGVILGSVRHPARTEKVEKGTLAYVSNFNGVQTTIDADGAYSVQFNGTPLQDLAPIQPGIPITEPQYNPLVAGSHFGFSSDGSYTVSDGSQFLKIEKNPVSGSITLCSGKNKVVLGGNPVLGETSITTDTFAVSALSTSIKSTKDIKAEALQVSIKGTQMAIGNDVFELFDGLSQLIDALGTLVVTSPVGQCTPLMAAPTWAAQVIPLKLKILTLKGSLASPDSPSESGGSLEEPVNSGLLV